MSVQRKKTAWATKALYRGVELAKTSTTAPTVTAAMTSKQVVRFVFEIPILGRIRGHKSTEHTEAEKERLHHGSKVWSYCLQGLPKALSELLSHLSAAV